MTLRDDAEKYRRSKLLAAKAAKRRYHARVESGLCVRCGTEPAVEGLRCDDCREAWNRYRAQRRKKIGA